MIQGAAEHVKERYCLGLSLIFRGGKRLATMPLVIYVLAKYARNDCLRKVVNEDDSTKKSGRTLPEHMSHLAL